MEKIRSEIEHLATAQETRKQLLDMGAEPAGGTWAQMAAQIKSELMAFESLAKQIKLVLE